MEVNRGFGEHHTVGFAFMHSEMLRHVFPVMLREPSLRIRPPLHLYRLEIKPDVSLFPVRFAPALDKDSVQGHGDIIAALGATYLDFLEGRIFDVS